MLAAIDILAINPIGAPFLVVPAQLGWRIRVTSFCLAWNPLGRVNLTNFTTRAVQFPLDTAVLAPVIGGILVPIFGFDSNGIFELPLDNGLGIANPVVPLVSGYIVWDLVQ